MTDPHEIDDFDAAGPLAVVEGLLDGARVDARALREALADPAARDHFVDLLVLRDAVAAMAPMDWSATRVPTRSRKPVLWLAAAAAVIVSVLAGYFAGQRVTLAAPVSASAIEAVVMVDEAPAAPPATTVIPLRPGVNWTE